MSELLKHLRTHRIWTAGDKNTISFENNSSFFLSLAFCPSERNSLTFKSFLRDRLRWTLFPTTSCKVEEKEGTNTARVKNAVSPVMIAWIMSRRLATVMPRLDDQGWECRDKCPGHVRRDHSLWTIIRLSPRVKAQKNSEQERKLLNVAFYSRDELPDLVCSQFCDIFERVPFHWEGRLDSARKIGP